MENLLPLGGFGFQPHAGPDIRVNYIGALDCRDRIMDDFKPAARCARILVRPFHHIGIRLIAFGSSHRKMRAQTNGRINQRMGNIISIADVSDLDPL